MATGNYEMCGNGCGPVTPEANCGLGSLGGRILNLRNRLYSHETQYVTKRRTYIYEESPTGRMVPTVPVEAGVRVVGYEMVSGWVEARRIGRTALSGFLRTSDLIRGGATVQPFVQNNGEPMRHVLGFGALFDPSVRRRPSCPTGYLSIWNPRRGQYQCVPSFGRDVLGFGAIDDVTATTDPRTIPTYSGLLGTLAMLAIPVGIIALGIWLGSKLTKNKRRANRRRRNPPYRVKYVGVFPELKAARGAYAALPSGTYRSMQNLKPRRGMGHTGTLR